MPDISSVMIFCVLIPAWASIATTVYWIEYLRAPFKFKWTNFKPLNCEACLSVWLFAIFVGLSRYYCMVILYIALAFTVGIVTPLIIKLIRKW